jgi:hypothetical protein
MTSRSGAVRCPAPRERAARRRFQRQPPITALRLAHTSQIATVAEGRRGKNSISVKLFTQERFVGVHGDNVRAPTFNSYTWTHEIDSHSRSTADGPRSPPVHGNGRTTVPAAAKCLIDEGNGRRTPCDALSKSKLCRRRKRSPHAVRRAVEAEEDQKEGITATQPRFGGVFQRRPSALDWRTSHKPATASVGVRR